MRPSNQVGRPHGRLVQRFADVAQLVEQLFRKQQVVRSNRIVGSMKCLVKTGLFICLCDLETLAQRWHTAALVRYQEASVF